MLTFELVVYAPTIGIARWIADEVAGTECTLRLVKTLGEATQLVSAARPGQIVLVTDVDALCSSDLLELQRLRNFGWKGVFVGLGLVTPELRSALSVTHVIAKPLGSEALRALVCNLEQPRTTQILRAPTTPL